MTDDLPLLELTVSPEAREVLDRISAARGGVPDAEVIRRALGTEKRFMEAPDRGERILVERPKWGIHIGKWAPLGRTRRELRLI